MSVAHRVYRWRTHAGLTTTLLALGIDSWENVRGTNPRIGIRLVPDSRIFVTDDRPEVVRDAIDDLARLR
jgi:hypothetical protein